MQNSLNITKKKLTVIFTLIVLGVAIFLEFVFFTGKYFNLIRGEKNHFIQITTSVERNFTSLRQFIYTFDIGNRLFKFKHDNPILSKQMTKKLDEEFLNFLVVERRSGELIFGNIVDDINKDFVVEHFRMDHYGSIEQSEGYLIKKIVFEERGNIYDIMFIKKLRYSFLDYITDLSWFVFVTVIFSILFYYIGFRFVCKNLEPVEQNLKDMQDFIHNAGHELKTPLSVISSNLQLLNELKKYDKELTKESLSEIKRLNKLLEGLVELSDINSISRIDDLDPKEELDLIISDYRKKADKKDIKMNLDVSNYSFIRANREYFYIFVSNLISNAIKYSDKGGDIDIKLYKNQLIIKDHGVGIDKENLDKIWDRFFQEDKSRNSKGFGIGLSLVRKIADIYKWKICVKSSKGDGTSFHITF